MTALHKAGKLDARFAAAYFRSVRPVFELYDLEQDPDELNNLSGKAEMKQIEYDLKLALHSKMILDRDYLPLPFRR